MQVTQSLGEVVGTSCAGDVLLSGLHVAVLQSQHTQVGVSLGVLAVDGTSLVQVLLCLHVVALLHSQHGQVVGGAAVLTIEVGGGLQNVLTLAVVLADGSSVEQLLDAELGGVFLVLSQDLLVAAADGLVVDGQTGAAQFRQDVVGQLAESLAHVLDLLLTLLRVLVHGEHAKDDLLVLDVAGLHQLLEAFPVLCGVLCGEGGLHLGELHLLLHVLLGVLLTLVGQLLVERHTTIRRCVCRNLYVVDVEGLLLLGDALEEAGELLDGIVLQLALAEVGLLDEELDGSIILLGVDALVGILRGAGLCVSRSRAIQLAGGNHAGSHLDSGHFHHFLADASVEGEVEVALLHGGLIGEVSLHGVVATHLVGDGLVVALHLLALEGCALSLHGLLNTVLGEAQLRSHGHHSLLGHVLLREHAIDGGRHLTGLGLQRIGHYLEVVCRQFSKLAAT